MSSFTLVPHSQDHPCSSFYPIANNVAAIAEVDGPLTVRVRHIRYWSPNTRVVGDEFYLRSNCLHSAFGSIRALLCQEPIQPLDIVESILRPD